MKIELSSAPAVRWETVRIGDETFEVQVTPPGYPAQMRDKELMATPQALLFVEHRLHTAITGWRGLETAASEPIPFTQENLAAVCTANPKVLPQLVALAHDAFRGLTEDEEKN